MESRPQLYKRTGNPNRRTGRAMERRFPGHSSTDDHSAPEGPPPLQAGPRAFQPAVDAGATRRSAGDPARNMAERGSQGGRILLAGPLGMPAEQTVPNRDAPQHISGIDNAELVAALVRGEGRAWTLLVDRFGRDVERLVAGALGVDADIADIVQDVFVRVMERIHQLRDPAALKGWISSVAVFAARGHIRKRRRWRWIRFLAPSDIPDTPAATASPESHAILRATYKVLEALPENERLAFSLRFISEMELTEVAAACGVSLATIKRRLARAEVSFLEGARRDPLLIERIERGERWKSP